MGLYEKTFDWVQFPEGRARFSGGVRGWDEKGHDTFAVELEGKVRYGEITRTYLANDNDFNIEIVSFGYGIEDNVGISSPNARGTYTEAQLKIVRSLVLKLIRSGLRFEDRPSALRETPKSHFMGQIYFCDGWAYLRPETVS